jgi:hypothetical protein
LYEKISEAKKRSIIIKKGNKFELNEKLWQPLKIFLEEIKKFEQTTDHRIPASSIIYYKKNDELVFSSKEKIDAVKTAFSAFGIDLLLTTDFYFLPKKKLKKKDILLHSLYVLENDFDARNLIFVALFYAKFKRELKIKHQIIKNLDAVFRGEEMAGYPNLKEIKERAEVYNIKV